MIPFEKSNYQMIHVGIDGRALQGHRAGTGRYVFELCKELDRLMPDAKFFVYSAEPVEMPVVSDRWVYRVDEKKWAKKLKSVMWLKIRAGHLCAKDDLDVFWANATFVPRLKSSVRVVSTVHDMAYLLVPETMKTVTYWAFRLFFRRDVARADDILCNSFGTKERLKKMIGVDSGDVVQPAIAPMFCKSDASSLTRVLEKYHIDGPYFLTVGTLEPRKNLESLIHEFSAGKRAGELGSTKLLLVGGGGWKNKKLVELIQTAGSDAIAALGFVDDADLPVLYSGAFAFVFPSIYEGFGMPVLEARACETPIIASDIPEIREAGGRGAYYFPVGSSIRNALKQFYSNTIRQSPDRDEFPTWRRGAEALARSFRASE
ncbi:glycosyltransferase family 4 protein [Variovorax ginsengisoli]|uniref:Glycosyltransferase involved in cell wall biosynthesis n=1 Tax=Variovorax ginsengisoli TaxID=363844 RepID=A0ABT9SFP1_9BURK|nr:glycosyltransferase family 1 protein [Variovorax ginsengisoli]MDP9902192.1 glycosyltransferase involved in cell wall biosynthesis [Variovorax ginsengisoli]